MMELMGAKLGKGLGKHLQGIVEPPAAAGQTSRAGLGKRSTTKRAAGPQQHGIMGYETAAGVKYGYPGERNGQIVLELTAFDGTRNTRTGELMPVPNPIDMLPALLWRGGPVGIAEATFPHPRGWCFDGFENVTLDKANVRILTAVFRSSVTKRPPCEKKWREALDLDIDISRIWHRFCRPSLTPRDFKNYYRYLMRSMLTRNLRQGRPLPANPLAPLSTMCRMCATSHERFSHIQMCDAIEETFQPLASLANALGVRCENDQQFRALGLTGGEFLQGTLSDLHIIVWKFVIIHMVAVDEDGQRFIPRDVWKAAVRRQQSRLVAHAGRTQLKLTRSGPVTQSQLDSWSSQVQPLVECYNDDGTQEASSPWSNVLHALDLND